MATAEALTWSPAELQSMPDGERYELVDGQLVERTMSLWSSYVSGRIFRLLSNFCEDNPLGFVLPEGTAFQCFPDDPGRVRRPDTSFISWQRISPEQAQTEGYVTIAPDLAVEVLSPNDLAYTTDKKVSDFLAAGTALVWVINPDAKTVAVHRLEGTSTILREHDELGGDNILPGFTCRLSELFTLPPGAPAPVAS